MMLRFYLLLALVFCAFPALAQTDLLGVGDESVTLFPEHQIGKPLETKADFANAYYENCLKTEIDEKMQDNLKTQCSCASAAMMEIMDDEQIRALSTDTKEGNFQRARFMVLGYIPCMKYPVHDIVLSNCLQDQAMQRTLKNDRKVCMCLAEDLSEYVVERGQNLVPGFMRFSYRDELAVDNPLAHVLESKGMELHSKSSLPRCVNTYERKL